MMVQIAIVLTAAALATTILFLPWYILKMSARMRYYREQNAKRRK
jgi:hypothetical protein